MGCSVTKTDFSNSNELADTDSVKIFQFIISNFFKKSDQNSLFQVFNSSMFAQKEAVLLNTIFLAATFKDSVQAHFDNWKKVNQALEQIQHPIQAQPQQNGPESSGTRNAPEPPGNVYEVDSFLDASGLEPKKVAFENSVYSISGFAGVVVAKRSSIILEETSLFYHFAPPENVTSREGFLDSTEYTQNIDQIKFAPESALTADANSAMGRVFSPTFYFKFLIASPSTFPIAFFAKGDINQPNSFGILLNQSGESFRVKVFVHDSQGSIIDFESDVTLGLDQIHSLSVSFVQIFGSFLQIVLSFDDGRTIESSQVMRTTLNNSRGESRLFPRVESFWNVFGIDNPSSGSIDDLGPSLGSLVLQYSQLNSASGLLGNAHFADHPRYVSVCLATCPVNYSFDPFAVSALNDSRLISAPNAFESRTCLSCSSVLFLFNSALLSSSLSPLTLDDLQKGRSSRKSNRILF